jgi:hypothetical protein
LFVFALLLFFLLDSAILAVGFLVRKARYSWGGETDAA